MEEMAETVYEQLRTVGVQCDKPHYFRDFMGFIKIGRKGLISISESKDGKIEYSFNYTPKKYSKKIDEVMKGLGIEKHVLLNVNFCP